MTEGLSRKRSALRKQDPALRTFDFEAREHAARARRSRRRQGIGPLIMGSHCQWPVSTTRFKGRVGARSCAREPPARPFPRRGEGK